MLLNFMDFSMFLNFMKSWDKNFKLWKSIQLYKEQFWNVNTFKSNLQGNSLDKQPSSKKFFVEEKINNENLNVIGCNFIRNPFAPEFDFLLRGLFRKML